LQKRIRGRKKHFPKRIVPRKSYPRAKGRDKEHIRGKSIKEKKDVKWKSP